MKCLMILTLCLFPYDDAEARINKTTASHHNASWYDASRGRTASGMRHAYSVAHRSLPFGTRVRVTNVRNGRSVEAVVTDRGPFVKGRTLDVNKAVARALGFISNGVATLRMEILGR